MTALFLFFTIFLCQKNGKKQEKGSYSYYIMKYGSYLLPFGKENNLTWILISYLLLFEKVKNLMAWAVIYFIYSSK